MRSRWALANIFKGRENATEASAWCAIALRDDSEVAARALPALVAAANKDGGWSTEKGAGSSDWTSRSALLALRVLAEQGAQSPSTSRAIKKAFEHMFDSRTEFYGSLARLLLLTIKGKQGLEYARGSALVA